MGIQDRDYMRRPTSFRGGGPPRDWMKILAIAGAVIGVSSAAVWLYRDVRGVVPDFGPDKGSLVVNINTATQEELETVPGVGPTRAAQIIAGRPYSIVDELVKLNGIGPAQVEDMKPFVTIDGPSSHERPKAGQ
jgi:competence ComEA-like helix-hairpin-helix protein